ncbi:MAG: response regulator [Anaerolineae bacterium]|nr:response regulator [Anaerolineae bacterium]
MLNKVHILYMEDNEGTARLMEKRLSRAGYMIDTASDGKDGLERHASRAYNAIIVDYNMPGMNGLQIIQRLAEQGTLPPTIMLTGTGNERIAVEALKLGAVDYVVKDIDGVYFDLLPTVIEQALKNQQLLEDKRRAEDALRESEKRFRMLFEEAPDPYFVADLSGNLIDCNQEVGALLDVNVDDLIGKHFTEIGLLAPDQLERVAGALEKMPEEMFPGPPELAVTRSDGGEIVVDLRVIPIQAKGETQILGIGHDITWRKQAELQMKSHIERLEILRRIDDQLTRSLDIQYVQTMALDSMLDLSGANAGSIALLGEGQVLEVRSVGYPEEKNRDLRLDKRSIVARVARQRKAEWIEDVTADPDYFQVIDDTCSQVTIPLISQGRMVGIINLESSHPECFNAEKFEFLKLISTRIAVAIDNARLYEVSQRQLAELQNLYEQVSKLEQLKTDMIRLAAHDLRNPLASILTRTYLLRKTLEDCLSEKQQEYIDAIDSNAGRMQDMISDFLSLERIEASAQGEAERHRVDLRDLVQHVSENHQPQADEKSLVYRLTVPDVPLWVSGSEIELQQVIANLLGNAIKYTPKGGMLEVSLQRQNRMARFEVVDTGYGIPADQQGELFQPFFRAQIDETESIEGTGLGLYLVKKFIERNRGEIVFYSEYGKGSTFGFTIPLVLE